MPDMIKDGTGKGYLAGVDSENRLKTYAIITDNAAVHAQEGDHFCWTTTHDAGANEFVLCVKNTSSTKKLCIETIRGCSDVATIWSAGFGTWSTVGGGSEIVGANSNASSGNIAEATCYSVATNFTADTVPLVQEQRAANGNTTFRPEGKFILGNGDVLYIKTSAASTTSITAIIHGFFKEGI